MGEEEEARPRLAALGGVTGVVTKALLAGMIFATVKKVAVRQLGSGELQKVKGFTQPYDGHKLSRAQMDDLEAGRKVIINKRAANAGGGRGTAICDIHAPPTLVWKTVTGFERYKGRLAQCKYSNVYERKWSMYKRTETIKVHMKLDGIIRDFNCYYEHSYKPDKNEMTWTLDSDKKSDFVDVQGQWCVEKHPSKPDWSRVYYSADVLLPAWLPRMVVATLCKTGGIKALVFAKKDAEAAFKSSSRGFFANRIRNGFRGGATAVGCSKILGRPLSVRGLRPSLRLKQ